MVDYNFSRKNKWRKRVWREVLKRTKNREKNDVILYLAGPDNLDMRVAKKMGVPVYNMIAVEKERSTTEVLRKNGVNVINGDMLDVLINWGNDNQDICAIIGDYCCGIEKSNIALYDFSAQFGVITVVNFQRGRDPFWYHRDMNGSKRLFGDLVSSGNDAMSSACTAYISTNVYEFVLWLCFYKYKHMLDGSLSRDISCAKKHRGFSYFAYHIYDMVMITLRRYSDSFDTFNDLKNLTIETFNKFDNVLRPVFLSYRSTSRIYMDSIIFGTNMWKKAQEKALGEGHSIDYILKSCENNWSKNRQVVRRIAAAKAVRTSRRKNAK